MDNNTTYAPTIFAYIKSQATIEEIANLLIVYAMEITGRKALGTVLDIENEQIILNEFLRTGHDSFNGLTEEFIFNYARTRAAMLK